MKLHITRTRGLKIHQKMIIVSIALVLLVGLVSLVCYQFSLNACNELLYDQTSTALKLYSEQIRTGMMTIEDLSSRLAVSPQIQDQLSILSSSHANDFSRYLARNSITQEIFNYMNPEILCITILPVKGGTILNGLDSSPEQPSVIQRAMEISKKANGVGTWITNERNDGSVLLVREIRKTNGPNFLECLGFLIIRVNLERVIEYPTGGSKIGEQLLLMVDKDGEVFYSSHKFEQDALDTLLLSNSNKYHIATVNKESLFLSRTYLKTTTPELNIINGLKYNDVFNSVIRATVITFLAITSAIALAIIGAGIAVRSVNRRFTMLVNKIERFKSGNLELLDDSSSYGRDEFGLLNSYCDELAVELKSMIDDNYVKQLLLLQAQLKNLEMQIHPHFLYNTLDTVRWFAVRSGEENIPTIVEALCKLLRNSLEEKEDVVTLERELSMLESYFIIQKIRHNGSLTVFFSIDPNTLNVKIPKMSIQPLVENAIIYSLQENIDGCRIVISSRVENDEVILSVENDGSEIDEDILDKLRNKKVSVNGQGIGLLNIDSRLKILFGNRYGLRFINGEDSVTVEIHIPKEGMSDCV